MVTSHAHASSGPPPLAPSLTGSRTTANITAEHALPHKHRTASVLGRPKAGDSDTKDAQRSTASKDCPPCAAFHAPTHTKSLTSCVTNGRALSHTVPADATTAATKAHPGSSNAVSAAQTPRPRRPPVMQGKLITRAKLADAEISPARPGKARKFLLERLRTHLQTAAAAAAEAWAEGLAQYEDDAAALAAEPPPQAGSQQVSNPFAAGGAGSRLRPAWGDQPGHLPGLSSAPDEGDTGSAGLGLPGQPPVLLPATAAGRQGQLASSAGRRGGEASVAMSLAKKLWVAEHVLSVETEWQRCANIICHCALPPGDAAWHSHAWTSSSNCGDCGALTDVWPESRLHVVCEYQASQVHRRRRRFVSSCPHLPLLCMLRAHSVHG